MSTPNGPGHQTDSTSPSDRPADPASATFPAAVTPKPGDTVRIRFDYVGEVDDRLMAKEPGKFQLGEIIGKAGFEFSHNAEIKGRDGQRRIVVDHLGREVALSGVVEPIPGHSVFLTLDAGLQQVLKEAFFRKFSKLAPEDQQKINQMIDMWGKKD